MKEQKTSDSLENSFHNYVFRNKGLCLVANNIYYNQHCFLELQEKNPIVSDIMFSLHLWESGKK